MLTRLCATCARRNTVLKPLKVQAQETNRKCKYHQTPAGVLAAAVATNPYVTKVPK
jgi:hypothetical protein